MAVIPAFIVIAEPLSSLRNSICTVPPVAPTATIKRAVIATLLFAARTPVVAPVLTLSVFCSTPPTEVALILCTASPLTAPDGMSSASAVPVVDAADWNVPIRSTM